jgi:glycerate dehydrogenase
MLFLSVDENALQNIMRVAPRCQNRFHLSRPLLRKHDDSPGANRYNDGMTNTDRWSIVFLDASTLDRGDMSFERFKAEWDCTFHPTTKPIEIAARIAGRQAVVTNKVVFDVDILALPETAGLKCIAVAAMGTNNVDLAAAKSRGIAVCNVAGYSTDSVVQQTFAFICELASRVGAYTNAVRRGEWEKSPTFTMLTLPSVELKGKTLGIVGYGQIGKSVAAIARAFGMNILVAARPGAEGPLLDGRVSLDDLMRSADVISLHCPLTPLTANCIDARAIAMMKPSAFIVNVARGGVVDEAALIAALREKRIAGAATDVLTKEPPPPDHPMVIAAQEMDNLLVTPHTAWTSREARQRLIDEIAENIAKFESGGERNRVA